MRIAITNNSDMIAGGENYVLFLADGLSKKNHDVTILPKKDSPLELKAKEAGYKTIGIPYSAKGLDEIPLIYNFYTKVKNLGIDIVHTNSNTDRTIGAFASKLLKCKNVAQIHSHFSIKQQLHHRFRNNLIDHFITDSKSSAMQLINEDKIKDSKVSAIHIGIPGYTEILSKEEKNNLKQKIGIRNNSLVVGNLARLVQFKGHKYLIHAFHGLAQIVPNVQLVIIGDGELDNTLKIQSAELGITDKILFTGYRNDADKLMQLFDLYVHPSINNGGESFPISILLALREGLPIVATNISDIPIQVINNYNGLIVSPQSPSELLSAMLELLFSKNKMNVYGENSSKHFYNNFTIDKMIDKIELLCSRMLLK